MAVVDNHVSEDGNFVVCNGDVGERDTGEGKTLFVVAKGFGLYGGVAPGDGDGDGDGDVEGVSVCGASDVTGDCVDGEGVAWASEATLDEDAICAAVPVDGACFEFVHPASGTRDGCLVCGWETEPACGTTKG